MSCHSAGSSRGSTSRFAKYYTEITRVFEDNKMISSTHIGSTACVGLLVMILIGSIIIINPNPVDAPRGGFKLTKPPEIKDLARLPEIKELKDYPPEVQKKLSEEQMGNLDLARMPGSGPEANEILMSSGGAHTRSESTYSPSIKEKMGNIMLRGGLQPPATSESLNLYGKSFETMFNSLIDFARPGFLFGMVWDLKNMLIK